MQRDYYLYLYTRNANNRYLICFGDPDGGVLVNAELQVLTLDSIEYLNSIFPLHVQGQRLIETPVFHDLDAVESKCTSHGPIEIDCALYLTAWNLFSDVARSVGEEGAKYLQSDRLLEDHYGKLFFGNNLPTMTPQGEHFTPTWSIEERESIRRHLLLGLNLFDKSIHDSPSSPT